MTQEDKELLLMDLCARLPYGVICSIYRIDDWNVGWRDEKLTGYFYNGIAYEFYFGNSPVSIDNDISKIKPYLRPLSSMTKEENKEYAEIVVKSQNCSYENNESATTMVNDWYLSKGFDVRGLIPKGLALEAPEGMYKNK